MTGISGSSQQLLGMNIDRQIVAQMRSACRLCEFRYVKIFLRQASGRIRGVLLVNPDYLLEEIVAGLHALEPWRDQAHVLQLMEQGVLRLVAEHQSLVHPDYHQFTTLLDAIPDSSWASVLQLESFLFAQVDQTGVCNFPESRRPRQAPATAAAAGDGTLRPSSTRTHAHGLYIINGGINGGREDRR